MREIIARIVDGRSSTSSAPLGTTLVTGFAHIEGMPVGIIANNGILFSESALKGAHFIELCCQRKIPLVFLQNITGFMVGQKVRNEGIARNGAKMVTAVATANVPKFTIIIGGSFGAGNYGMCGRAYSPRFCGCGPTRASASWVASRRPACWPRCAATASRPRAASGAWRRKKPSKPPSAASTKTQGHPYYATARLWDDGIIDPPTRAACWRWACRRRFNAPIEDVKFGVFRM